MAEHTPGPWTLGAQYPDEIHAAQGQIAEALGGRWVGSSPYEYEVPAEVAANARLIAAAPEMLEALQDVVNYFWGTEAPVLKEGDVESFVKAAIRKARGE